MSAQFIDIYEIGSDAPIVSTLTSDNDKKDPLNLTLEIYKNKIYVKTGFNNSIVKIIKKQGKDYNYEELNKTIIKIKRENLKENSVILKPSSVVPYYTIVKIMDQAREIQNKTEFIIKKNDQGRITRDQELFNQIIFDTLI